VAKAQAYVDAGDLRFAAQLLKHAVFADPAQPRRSAGRVQRLSHGAESTHGNYLSGATELRRGSCPPRCHRSAPAWPGVDDRATVRLDRHPRRRSEHLTIDWHLTDLDESYG
jgi:alkyl sulfatase BDS1-like metallo-beta-lactamase superfamily hydrolase